MYVPINNDGKHWLVGEVDIVKRHIALYDSEHKARQDWFQFNNAEPLNMLVPYILKVIGFYNHRQELTDNGNPSLDRFTISRTDVASFP